MHPERELGVVGADAGGGGGLPSSSSPSCWARSCRQRPLCPGTLAGKEGASPVAWGPPTSNAHRSFHWGLQARLRKVPRLWPRWPLDPAPCPFLPHTPLPQHPPEELTWSIWLNPSVPLRQGYGHLPDSLGKGTERGQASRGEAQKGWSFPRLRWTRSERGPSSLPAGPRALGLLLPAASRPPWGPEAPRCGHCSEAVLREGSGVTGLRCRAPGPTNGPAWCRQAGAGLPRRLGRGGRSPGERVFSFQDKLSCEKHTHRSLFHRSAYCLKIRVICPENVYCPFEAHEGLGKYRMLGGGAGLDTAGQPPVLTSHGLGQVEIWAGFLVDSPGGGDPWARGLLLWGRRAWMEGFCLTPNGASLMLRWWELRVSGNCP